MQLYVQKCEHILRDLRKIFINNGGPQNAFTQTFPLCLIDEEWGICINWSPAEPWGILVTSGGGPWEVLLMRHVGQLLLTLGWEGKSFKAAATWLLARAECCNYILVSGSECSGSWAVVGARVKLPQDAVGIRNITLSRVHFGLHTMPTLYQSHLWIQVPKLWRSTMHYFIYCVDPKVSFVWLDSGW